jgi:hypothetical protein
MGSLRRIPQYPVLMTTPPGSPVDELGLPIPPDHEAHRHGKPPRVKLAKRLQGRLGLVPTAIPGISLTNYSIGPLQKGWGAHCSTARTTITLSNGVRITVASRIALLSTLILNECIRRGYNIRQADTGAYNCRYISGTTVWSNHAWALAIDTNWLTNPYTTAHITDQPQWMFDLFNRYGFANGADYTGAHDWMHHEFMGTPEQADQATALAQAELGNGDVPTPSPVPPSPPSDVQTRIDQYNLNDTGFPCTVDGVWGPASVQACRDFQFAAHLVTDGICGDATRAALRKVPSWHSGGNIADDPGGYSNRTWQQKLADHGWRIAVDNVWGTHSRSILSQFQADKQITVDGNRGPQSWTCLHCTVN